MARELTTIAIENLKPGPKRQEIPDGRVPSLYLVLQSSGKKSWAYRYSLGGRKHKLTLGGFPLVALKEAREAAWKAKDAVARGIDPAAARKASLAAPAAPDDLVEDIVDEFLLRHGPNLKASTLRGVARILRKDVASAWRGRSLAIITKKDVHRLLDAVTDRGAPVAANRVLAWVRKMCSWAVSRGVLETNPCVGVEAPTLEVSRERVLNDNELAAVWSASAELDAVHAAFVRLLVLTGARRGEVAKMAWSEIDLESATWKIPAVRTKNGHEHIVALSDLALDILHVIRRPPGSTFVLSLVGRRPFASFDSLKKKLDALLPPDMERWTLHDIRRGFASGCGRLGVAPHVIESMINHKSGAIRGIARTYNRHDYLAESRASFALWAQHIDGLVNGRESNVVPIRGTN